MKSGISMALMKEICGENMSKAKINGSVSSVMAAASKKVMAAASAQSAMAKRQRMAGSENNGGGENNRNGGEEISRMAIKYRNNESMASGGISKYVMK